MDKRGPKTERGKAASSRNAIKHGLRAQSPVIPGESHDEWQRHLDAIFDSLQPQNYLEEQFARLVALGFWRRWRIERYEVEVTTAYIARAEEDLQIAHAYADRTLSKGILPEVPAALVEASRRRRILPPDVDLDKIMRYKGSEHRQLLQNMHELEAVQARRRGERMPLARFDFSGPPAG